MRWTTAADSHDMDGEVSGSVTRTFDDDLRVSTIAVNEANPITYLYDDDGW